MKEWGSLRTADCLLLRIGTLFYAQQVQPFDRRLAGEVQDVAEGTIANIRIRSHSEIELQSEYKFRLNFEFRGTDPFGAGGTCGKELVSLRTSSQRGLGVLNNELLHLLSGKIRNRVRALDAQYIEIAYFQFPRDNGDLLGVWRPGGQHLVIAFVLRDRRLARRLAFPVKYGPAVGVNFRKNIVVVRGNGFLIDILCPKPDWLGQGERDKRQC